MYVIALYGLFIIAMSLWMIGRPAHWVEKGIEYCRKPYMHPLEILLCIGFGVPFLVYGPESRFPIALDWFGHLLVVVGVGLIFVPPSVHRRFGIWSLGKFSRFFRPAGFVSLALGVLLIYAVLP